MYRQHADGVTGLKSDVLEPSTARRVCVTVVPEQQPTRTNSTRGRHPKRTHPYETETKPIFGTHPTVPFSTGVVSQTAELLRLSLEYLMR